MPPSPAMRCSPIREIKGDIHKKGRGLEGRILLREKNDDLALFNEMKTRERDSFLLQSNDDFEHTFSMKLRYLSDYKLGMNQKTKRKTRKAVVFLEEYQNIEELQDIIIMEDGKLGLVEYLATNTSILGHMTRNATGLVAPIIAASLGDIYIGHPRPCDRSKWICYNCSCNCYRNCCQ